MGRREPVAGSSLRSLGRKRGWRRRSSWGHRADLDRNFSRIYKVSLVWGRKGQRRESSRSPRPEFGFFLFFLPPSFQKYLGILRLSAGV